MDFKSDFHFALHTHGDRKFLEKYQGTWNGIIQICALYAPARVKIES